MATGKKTFKMNPAMSFISQESIDKVDGVKEEPVVKEEDKPVAKAPKKEAIKEEKPFVKRAPINFKEPKSKRVQLLTQPSLYEAIAEKAASQGISVNEAINEAMKLYASK